tara:strand:- start:2258 stop:2707 length:450 start_codon:yes stop_codon:yes gene_type:complete
MVEIDNHLSKDICNYLISYFNQNKDKSEIYNGRKLIKITNLNNDVVVEKIVSQYSKYYPNHYLKNMELIFWPVGEYHNWHDDTIYYDKTTITYLNDDYVGGRTQVENYEVKPQTGKIILFDANKKHKVSKLLKGERYVILAWYNLCQRK